MYGICLLLKQFYNSDHIKNKNMNNCMFPPRKKERMECR